MILLIGFAIIVIIAWGVFMAPFVIGYWFRGRFEVVRKPKV